MAREGQEKRTRSGRKSDNWNEKRTQPWGGSKTYTEIGKDATSQNGDETRKKVKQRENKEEGLNLKYWGYLNPQKVTEKESAKIEKLL